MWHGIWLIAAGVLLIGAVPPGVVLSARGRAEHRLVGLQTVSATVTLALVALCLGLRRPDYLIVPLALVLLSFAGTLVFTRLVGETG